MDSESGTDTDSESTEAFVLSEQHSRDGGASSLGRRRHSEHHRRHEFLDERLEAYSDAVFAIVATILIAYLRHIVPAVNEQDVSIREGPMDRISLFAVYHFTFFHVTIIWLNHSKIFDNIERVNDSLVWLNMCLLYVVSFVPLTFGLLAEYWNTYYGILIPSLTLVVVNIIMTIIVWYAFKRERLLHTELLEEYYIPVKSIMYINLLIGPVFAVLAIVFGGVYLPVGQVLFCLSALMLVVPRLIVYIYWRRLLRRGINPGLTQALGIYISKERIGFFTDGIYSIVATLVILEITVDGIPSREMVNEEYNGSLVKALFNRRLAYTAHFTTFLVISILWFVHNSMFNFVRKLNPLMLIVHLCSCSLTGAIPSVVEVLSHLIDTGSGENVVASIQLVAVVITVVGTLQLVLLSLMYFADRECIDPTLFHAQPSLHLFLKAMVIPVTSTIGYWCSLGSPELCKYTFYILYLCSPLTFIIINIAMNSEKLRSLCVYCWEAQNRSREMLWKRMSRSFEAEMEVN